MQAHSASKQTTSPVSALSMRCPPAHCIENTSLFDDMRSPDSPRRDLSRPPLVQAGIRRCVGRGGRSLPRLQGPVGQGRHSRNHVNARLSWLSFCWRDSLDSPPPPPGHPSLPPPPPTSPSTVSARPTSRPPPSSVVHCSILSLTLGPANPTTADTRVPMAPDTSPCLRFAPQSQSVARTLKQEQAPPQRLTDLVCPPACAGDQTLRPTPQPLRPSSGRRSRASHGPPPSAQTAGDFRCGPGVAGPDKHRSLSRARKMGGAGGRRQPDGGHAAFVATAPLL